MIQETIRQLISNKLNDNTADKKFIVGKYIYNEDDKRNYLYSIRDRYTLIEKDFISCMVTFAGDFEAMPNQINGYVDINVEFLLNGENDTDLNTDLDILDELKPKIIGNFETFVDNSTTYKSVWNMGLLSPNGITLVNGTYYTSVQTTISIDFSDTNSFGNEYKYGLNSNILTPYGGSNDRENEINYPHRYGDTEAKGGNDESRWTLTLQTYVDSFTESIADSIASETYDMTTVYTFKQYKYDSVSGDYVVINEFPVQISSISQPILLGEKQYITINLIKSDIE